MDFEGVRNRWPNYALFSDCWRSDLLNWRVDSLGLCRIRFVHFVPMEVNRAMALTKAERVESLEEMRASQMVVDASTDLDKLGRGGCWGTAPLPPRP